MTEQNNLVEQFKQAQAALGHGCHDGYCVIEKTVGMHTNGGCRCLKDTTFTERQYVGHMLRIAQELVKQNVSLQAELDATKTKLAKAVETLEYAKRLKEEAFKISCQLPQHSHSKHDIQEAADLFELKEGEFNTLAEIKGE